MRAFFVNFSLSYSFTVAYLVIYLCIVKKELTITSKKKAPYSHYFFCIVSYFCLVFI